ncbi:hypothetical protein F5Y19DRAFT_482700 [Xylariaceae sp. FL1651]|nr:hypothetical protein F5Y19DRAFT_482700 [Xylariaceae sp. FL1651]
MHRWMHERGACSCAVKFPALQEPRVVHRSSIASDEKATAAVFDPRQNNHFVPSAFGGHTQTGPGVGASGAGSYAPKHVSSAGNPATIPHHSRQFTPPNTPGQEKEAHIPPLYKEIGSGNGVEVTVRLSSLWAAEWTKDHAKLHQTGQCKCAVNFEPYQPIITDEPIDGMTTPKMVCSSSSEHAGKGAGKPASFLQGFAPQLTTTAPSSHSADTRTSMPDTIAAGTYYKPAAPQQPAVGQAARWTFGHPQGSLLDEILGPVGPNAGKQKERTIEVQTVHYNQDGTPLSGYPIGYGPAADHELPSIVEFPRPETIIAGFPIGAGPEEEPHAGDFENCSLNTSANESPIRKRRLSSEF